MTTPLSALALITQQTKEQFLSFALGVARIAGLPVDTWRVGDPTRTQLVAQAEKLETLDQQRAEIAKAAFLATAEGDWLPLRGRDVYGVEKDDALPSEPTVEFDNPSGGLFELEVGQLVLLASTTGATFTNQVQFTIDPVTFGISTLCIAQIAGSVGTVGVDEIDTIVAPTMPDVTIASSTAAIGTDEQSSAAYRAQCLATLGALSPNGPADAYEYVARNEELTGVTGVSRAQSSGDNATGTVAVYVGTATASLAAPELALIQAAIDLYAQPLCTDATVVSMTPIMQAATFNLTPDHPELQDGIEAALDAYFAEWDYEVYGGLVARDALATVVRKTAEAAGVTLHIVGVTSPAADVAYAVDEFPVRGTVVLT